jgi:hypothetical protein
MTGVVDVARKAEAAAQISKEDERVVLPEKCGPIGDVAHDLAGFVDPGGRRG